MNDRSRHILIFKARMFKGRKLTVSAAAVFVAAAFLMFVLEAGMTPKVQAQTKKPAAANESGNTTSEVARGKYLVEDVAMCGQCHTPRDSGGNVDRSRWLQGAPVPWMPSEARTAWPMSAPRIGGNPPATDAEMVKLLTTGIWTTGKPLRFPMMPFRMSEVDAKAVVAYLKSLTPQ